MTGNNRDYREKGRAVFLAAIMVLSMVAMSATFVGMAAADAQDIKDVEEEPGEVTFVVEHESNDENLGIAINPDDHWADHSGSEQKFLNTTDDPDAFDFDTPEDDNITVTVDISDLDVADNYDIYANASDVEVLSPEDTEDTGDGELSTWADAEEVDAFDVDAVDFEIQEIDHPDEVVPGSMYDVSVTVRNIGDVDGAEDVDYAYDDDADVDSDPTTEVTNDSVSDVAPGETEVVDFDDVVADSDEGTWYYGAKTQAGTHTDYADFGVDSFQVTEDAEDVEDADVTYHPERPWAGQDVIAFGEDIPNEENEYDLRRVDDFNGDVSDSTFIDELVSEPAGEDRADLLEDRTGQTVDENDHIVVIDTDDLDTDDYFLRGGDLPRNPSADDTFEVRVQDLDVDFDDDEVDDAGADSVTDLDVDSNRGTYTLNVSADGDLDDEELFGIFAPDADYDDADANRSNVNASWLDDRLPGEQRDQLTAGGEYFGDWNVALYNETEDDYDEKVVLIGISDQEEEVDFDGIDDGEYTFDFDSYDTEASASDSITVVDVEDVEAELLTRSIDQEVGDKVEIEVEVSGDDDTFTIAIGNDEDDGYEYHAVVEVDDETTTLVFDSYAAGDTSWADNEDIDILRLPTDDEFDDDEIVYQAQYTDDADIEGLLDAGDYDITVMGGDARDEVEPADEDDLTADEQDDFAQEIEDEADDVTGLFLNELDVRDVNTWTAPGSNWGDYDDLEDISEGVEDDEITEADQVARGDIAIMQIDSTSLSGLLDVSASDDVDDQDVTDRFEHIVTENYTDIAVEQTDPQANRRAMKLNVTNATQEDVFQVIADAENDEYYVQIQTGDAFHAGSFERGGNPVFPDNSNFPDDDDFNLEFEFEVTDSALLDVDSDEDAPFANAGDEPIRNVVADDDDDHIAVVTDFDVPERESEFDQDEPMELNPAADQEVTGTSTVAPGTELRVRLSSTGDTQPRFTLPREVDLAGDRTFSETFDFSDQAVGDEFEARVRTPAAGGFDRDTEEIDGEFVEEETPTPEPDTPTPEPDTPEPDTPEPDTPTPEPDTPDEPDEPDTPEPEQHGFGVIVGILALLGAALLAARRRA